MLFQFLFQGTAVYSALSYIFEMAYNGRIFT